jgi:hypothetical protein
MSRSREPIWETTDDDRIVLEDYPSSGYRDYQPRFARGVGGASVQDTKAQAAKTQAAKIQAAKLQAANAQVANTRAAKTQAAKTQGDRRTEFAPRMPRRAAR